MASVVKSYQKARFKLGEYDCCLFAADCIHALTGRDPLADFRGRYATPIEAFTIIDGLGFDSFGALAESKFQELGFLEIAPVMAQRGDIGMVEGPRLDNTLGVCLGSKFAFFADPEMIYLGHESLLKAWRIG